MTVTLAKQRPGYGPPAPVPVFQWEVEFTQLLELYRERAPERVLEVGTYHGGTLYHWLTNAAPGATIVSVDSYTTGVDNRDLYDKWAPPGVTVVAIEGDSAAGVTADLVADHAPFQLVWIDAGHFYYEVKLDWETYRRMCAPGGVVVFHDILPPSQQHREIQVNQLWNEIKAAGYKTGEIIANKDASWGGIGIVYT